LERLQARAGARYVIGQDRDRDRKRREELFRLRRSNDLTAAQIAEMAEFDIFYEKEDRESRRNRSFFTKILLPASLAVPRSPTLNGSSTLN
jgi:L-ribulose-5-phosphate 3-epimerase UlaE